MERQDFTERKIEILLKRTGDRLNSGKINSKEGVKDSVEYELLRERLKKRGEEKNECLIIFDKLEK